MPTIKYNIQKKNVMKYHKVNKAMKGLNGFNLVFSADLIDGTTESSIHKSCIKHALNPRWKGSAKAAADELNT